MLLLGGVAVLSWIVWWFFSNAQVELQAWINQDFYPTYIRLLSFSALGFFTLIFIIRALNKISIFEIIIPYITIAYFGLIFVFGAHCIGVFSPASSAGYVSLVTVALVLFERKVVYLIIIPITGFMLISLGLSLMNKMTYAPIFSEHLQSMSLYKNTFWVFCMLYFYIPIFFASLVLFEVLLIQWRKREQMIQRISVLDPLTGIYNRRRIGENIDLLKQQQSSFAIVLLDLDYFKSVNDQYGHDIGDAVLKQVAKILTENIREQDVVGRFGGEEFIILLSNGALENALRLAERCRQAIEKEEIRLDHQQTLKVTASFGVAVSTNPFLTTKEELIRQADQAYIWQKIRGAIRFVISLK
ncbi:GGDEF domain-containing protein [Acinetobacter sp. ULE_I064]|uniref:GGDEF domain-containing protein n=1 Tax=Acinetobacter sp. ULE_I064 TaxID=3373071 RepID=UPI003AF7EA2E